MKNYFTTLLMCLGFLVAGCSTLTVNHDYDNNANFTALKTYDWLPIPAEAGDNVKAAMKYNTLLDKRIHDSVDRYLADHGYQQSSNPDFYVTYHTGIENKVEVTDWGYGYGSWRPFGHYGWYGRDLDVKPYSQGTLLLDIIDAKIKQLIWRGYASSAIDENISPEKREKNIDTAVTQLLAKFPPKLKEEKK